MNSKPILIVEDNPDDQKLALRAFKKCNLSHTIIFANDGVEAGEYLFGDDSNKKKIMPAVVLLDLNMPRKNGLELLKDIRQNESTRFLPVVVITTSKEEQDLINSYSLGVNSYVRKPVNFNEFLEAVKSLGLYWLLLNECPSS